MDGNSLSIINYKKEVKLIETKKSAIGIKVIDSSQFFVGYLNGGSKIINDKGVSIKEYLIGKSVTNFLIDHEGGYWFTTSSSGVYYIKKSSVSIFLFGNKIVDGEIKLSNGMKEEFEISREMGNIIIPIASTGYMSKEIYKTFIRTDIPDNIKKLISDLSTEKNPHLVVSKINEIIDMHKIQ